MLNCVGCNYMSSPFKELQDKELELFVQRGATVKFAGGEMVFKQNTPISQVVFVRTGCIKILRQEDHSSNYVQQLFTGPGFLGLTETFSESYYNYSAVTMGPAEICFIDKDAFDKVLNLNGRFASCMLQQVCIDESERNQLNNTIFRRQLAGRVARILLYFSDTVFNSPQFVLPLTKAEMASLIGVSNRSLARTLVEFRQDGLIGYSGLEMILLRKEFLEKISQQ